MTDEKVRISIAEQFAGVIIWKTDSNILFVCFDGEFASVPMTQLLIPMVRCDPNQL